MLSLEPGAEIGSCFLQRSCHPRSGGCSGQCRAVGDWEDMSTPSWVSGSHQLCYARGTHGCRVEDSCCPPPPPPHLAEEEFEAQSEDGCTRAGPSYWPTPHCTWCLSGRLKSWALWHSRTPHCEGTFPVRIVQKPVGPKGLGVLWCIKSLFQDLSLFYVPFPFISPRNVGASIFQDHRHCNALSSSYRLQPGLCHTCS